MYGDGSAQRRLLHGISALRRRSFSPEGDAALAWAEALLGGRLDDVVDLDRRWSDPHAQALRNLVSVPDLSDDERFTLMRTSGLLEDSLGRDAQQMEGRIPLRERLGRDARSRGGFKIVVATRKGEPMVFTGFASRSEAERKLDELRTQEHPSVKRNAVWEILDEAEPHAFVVKARIDGAWRWWGVVRGGAADPVNAIRLTRSRAEQQAALLRTQGHRDVVVEPAPPEPVLTWKAVLLGRERGGRLQPVVDASRGLRAGVWVHYGPDKVAAVDEAKVYAARYPGTVISLDGHLPSGEFVEGLQVWSNAAGRVESGNPLFAAAPGKKGGKSNVR